MNIQDYFWKLAIKLQVYKVYIIFYPFFLSIWEFQIHKYLEIFHKSRIGAHYPIAFLDYSSMSLIFLSSSSITIIAVHTRNPWKKLKYPQIYTVTGEYQEMKY